MKNKKTAFMAWILSSALIFGVSFTGCKDGQENSGSDSSSEQMQNGVTLSLDKNAYTVMEDEEFNLTVTTNSLKAVAWSSSDYSVASVTSSGRVLAKKAGETVITAEIDGVKDTCTLTVLPAQNNSADILAESWYDLSVKDGTGMQIQATYVKIDGDVETPDVTKVISYASMDESIATVSADGVIKPVSEGTTDIVLTAGGVTSYVTADVYTDDIADTSDWLNMFKEENLNDTTKRFYLSDDIDFDGVDYSIGNVAYGAYRDKLYFAAELDGKNHTVQNITMPNMEGERQSLFGQIMGATIKNISFENVTFTQDSNAGLAWFFRQHITVDGVNQVYTSTVSDVALDFIYDCDAGCGFSAGFYGGVISDVFIRMRKADGGAFGENFYGFASGSWIWFGGGLKDVLIYTENGEIPLFGKEEGNVLPKDNVDIFTSVMSVAYNAHNNFDSNVWDLLPNALPKIKK